MADRLEIGVDYSETVRMFEAFGFGAKAHLRAVSFITANAVKVEAQARIAKGRPFTVKNVVVEARRSVDGYVVMMNRNVKDTGGLQGAAQNVSKKTERHVGKWLEFGTVHRTARPWLFPAADAQEGAHLQRVIAAIERAKAEAGGNG